MKKFNSFVRGFASIAVLALAVVLVGCNDDGDKPLQYRAYGMVRSVWLECHGSTARTVISFAPDSDPERLITIEFQAVEPSLWQNMHAVIEYGTVMGGSGGFFYATCVYDQRQLFRLLSVRQLR